MADTSKPPQDAPDPNAPPVVAPDLSTTAAAKPADKAHQRPQTAVQPKAAKVTWYKVLHGAVGQWEQGRKVSSDEMTGIDVGRLLRLQAIEVTTAPEEEAPASDE